METTRYIASGSPVDPIAVRHHRYNPRLDAWRNYRTDGLTFTTLLGLLRLADNGDAAAMLELSEEMEGKDLHLQGVANARRMGLTGLPWEIVSAADRHDIGERGLADEAADYCRGVLSGIERFDEVLEHLALAIGPNLSVVETVWQGGAPTDFELIPAHRLIIDMQRSRDVRLITEENQQGELLPSINLIAHCPHSRAGFPFKVTIARAQAVIYLIKHFAMVDWATYLERFGMPIRTGKYAKGATAEEKTELEAMLKGLGSDAWAMFSEAAEINLVESAQRGTAPYKDMIDLCERKQSIGYLGGHMMTDTSGATGTHATASVQSEVRADLLVDDIRREGRTIRRQLLKPMVALNWPGIEVPVPFFERTLEEPIDRGIEADTIFKATQQIGLRVGKKWAYERLGIPEPEADEAVIDRIPQATDNMFTDPAEFA